MASPVGRGGRSDAADPYLYPGTDVLRNRFGVRDAAALRLLEYAATAQRAASAPVFPPTVAGLLATHRHPFGDVYAWAGTPRTVEVAKGAARFASAAFVAGGLERRFRDLEAAGALRGLDADAFATGAAHHASEVNAIHPFREGNGRTTRLHLKHLASLAGHDLDLTRIPAAEWIAASVESFGRGDERRMTAVIRGALVGRTGPAAGGA